MQAESGWMEEEVVAAADASGRPQAGREEDYGLFHTENEQFCKVIDRQLLFVGNICCFSDVLLQRVAILRARYRMQETQ